MAEEPFVRNTRPAPPLARCGTCGATEIDGNGPIVDFRGHAKCTACAQGAQELLDDGWAFDEVTGRLVDPTGATQRWQARMRAQVDQLHTAAVAAFADDPQVRVEIYHDTAGVAVVAGDVRLHVRTTDADPSGQGRHTAILFDGRRTLVPSGRMTVVALAADPDEAAAVLVAVLRGCRDDASTLGGLYAEHRANEALVVVAVSVLDG